MQVCRTLSEQVGPHFTRIIGAEANLAARLQSIAEPGHIVISYETYALVRDITTAHPLPPISMKGISREVIPYAVETTVDSSGQQMRTFSEHMRGLDFYFDPGARKRGERAARDQELLADQHHLDQLGRVGIEIDHVAGLARGLRAGLHGDADVGLRQRGSIVGAVAGHGDELAARLLAADQSQLVLGGCLGVHQRFAEALATLMRPAGACKS